MISKGVRPLEEPVHNGQSDTITENKSVRPLEEPVHNGQSDTII
jgi:hypothetical protein